MRMRGFRYARIASKQSDFHKQHLGAALLYKGKLIAVGYNSEKTHSNQGFYNQYRDFDVSRSPCKLHAEMMVLNKVQYLDIDFSKAELYVWRGKDENHPQLSRPCPACEARIKDMGIKKVCYTGNGKYCEEKYV